MLRPRLDALIFPAGDILERALKVLARILQPGRVVVRVEVRVDELDEAVDVFGRDLEVIRCQQLFFHRDFRPDIDILEVNGMGLGILTASFSWSK